MTTITQVDPDHRSSWFSPEQCKQYYGKPYKPIELHIHWWDDPSKKPSHDGVVAYIKKKTGGSVNYVVSAGKVTCMVAEENCALTTQSGNPYGIKLECSPYGTDEDYRTIGQLVADIQRRRGRLPLVPHKRYYNTSCPGTLNLARIQAEADKFNAKENIVPPVIATDKQRDETIAAAHQGVFGKPATDEVFKLYRPLLKNNYVEGTLTMLKQFNDDARAAWRSKAATEAADPDGEKWRNFRKLLEG